ncbi:MULTISPECIES: glycosyltransferase [Streptomyces]|uniref:glycosyltransferase n=1 Tax=Streptomyces TaxID=1883 RepID=UPI00178645A5|nr:MULTISPECIES: glycosyltransferase [unclassified Streptomyces]MDX3088927.1 glycosyltransferase [Streptomyces sp. ME12-02E]MDX3334518.1 glycosyltransferase [Streptomyces sp. ME02-6978a]MDX3359991.1 glycosyltransferase [Streptomyces sp. ME02-6978.2a]GHE37910.1 glycosyl transferase [Streptomyces griseoaurantiacus]
MRVLLSTYGTRGDVEPLVALAVRLRALGAEVRMCTPPDEEFARRLKELGIEQVAVGPPVRTLMRDSSVPTAEELSQARDRLVDEQFAVLPAAAEGCGILVAAGLGQVAARSVAEAAGIRYVHVTYAAVNLPSPHHAPPPRPGWPEPAAVDNRTLWERDARLVTAQFGEALNRHRAALGLGPVDNVRDHVLTARPWLAADPALGPWPAAPGLEVTQTGPWMLPDDRPLPPDLVSFLRAGAPPVYVGFGSLRPAEGIGGKVIEAVRARGHRVLVSRGWADLEPIDDGEDCFALGEVSHQSLFPELAAVVHHGGAGTTQTAARAGVPQLVVPLHLSDNLYWAGRVADLGLGTTLDGPSASASADSLYAAFGTVLDPATRARARSLAERMRTDGAETAARLLLASRH